MLPVHDPAGIFSLALLLLALMLSGEDFLFSALTLLTFIPGALRVVVRGLDFFHLSLRILLEMFPQCPELQPGMGRARTPSTVLG